MSGADRDSWVTPEWLTALLPEVDLDPCSNDRSTVRALRTYDLARGEDGLALPWVGSVFLNFPYSNPLPWADKLVASPDVTAAAVLCNTDHSTKWWARLTERLCVELRFSRRIQFGAPPGVKASTNSKAQSLLMDGSFFALCSPVLLGMGSIWWLARRAV